MSSQSSSRAPKVHVPRTPDRKKPANAIPTPPITPKKRVRSDRPPLIRSRSEAREKRMREILRKQRILNYTTKDPPNPPLLDIAGRRPPQPFPLLSPLRLQSPTVSNRRDVGSIDLTRSNRSGSKNRRSPPTKKRKLEKAMSSNGQAYRVRSPRESPLICDDVIDLTSDTLGEPAKNAPGEKPYYGRSTSRVQLDGDTGPASPPRTRGWRRRAAQPVSSGDEKHELVHGRNRRDPAVPKPSRKKHKHTNNDALDEHEWVPCSTELLDLELRPDWVLPDPPSPGNDFPDAGTALEQTYAQERAARSTNQVGESNVEGMGDDPAEHDEDDETENEYEDTDRPSSPIAAPRRKKRRVTSNRYVLSDVSNDGDTSPDAESQSVESGRGDYKEGYLSAYEDACGDDGSEVHDSGEEDGDDGYSSLDDRIDDYDREDSFIDDEPLEEIPFFDIRRSTSPLSASQLARQHSDDSDSGRDEDDDLPSDEDTQLAVAKIESLISGVRDHMSVKEYKSKLRGLTRAIKMVAAQKTQNRTATIQHVHGRPDREDVGPNNSRDERHSTRSQPSTLSSRNKKGKGRETGRGLDEASPPSIKEDPEDEDLRRAIASSLQESRHEHQSRPAQSVGAGSSGSPSKMSLPEPSKVGPVAPPAPITSTGPPVAAHTSTQPSMTASTTSTTAPSQVAPFTMSALMAQMPGPPVDVHQPLVDDGSFKPVSVLLPDVDATYDPALHDRFLKDDYAALPNLPAGQFMPWTNSRSIGHWSFEKWALLSPDMNASLALAGIRFQDSGAYINPSRASVVNLQLRDVPAKNPRFHLMRDFKNVYCVLSGMVLRCQLYTPTKGGMRKKEIQIVPYKQESERSAGWSCLVLGENPLGCQIWRGAMQLTTRALQEDTGGSSSTIAVNPNPAASSSGDGFSLAAEDEVPIYDGRQVTNFNFDTDLPHLATRMPKWSGGELPFGSCAIVGYTMSKYLSNKGVWSVGWNIHWVILLGLPDEAVAKTMIGR